MAPKKYEPQEKEDIMRDGPIADRGAEWNGCKGTDVVEERAMFHKMLSNHLGGGWRLTT